MTQAGDLLGLLCAACVGWGTWRWYRRFPERPNPVVVIALWSVVGPALWMLFLALVGVGWPVSLLVVPSVVALILGVTAQGPHVPHIRTRFAWVLPAAVLAGGHAVLLALRAPSGWDFRYLWALKAKVFALAATHDTGWLSWSPNVTQHPAYPPLWSDLLAMGIRLGGSVEGVAAAWDAFLVIALAAACWDNLRDAPPALRLTGSAVGACAPLLLSSAYSGYADLVVAFLAAVALGSLVRLNRLGGHDPAALLSLSGAVAGLCLVKNEGMVLAIGVTLAALWFGNRRAKIVAVAAFALAVVPWQLFVTLTRIPREPRSFDLHAWVGAGHQMLVWLRVHSLSPIALLLLAWLLAGTALAKRASFPAAVALTVWWCGVTAAYLSSLDPTLWHMSTSFDRVIAAPLPAALSVALGACARAERSLPSTEQA
jgi:hypothetical protein